MDKHINDFIKKDLEQTINISKIKDDILKFDKKSEIINYLKEYKCISYGNREKFYLQILKDTIYKECRITDTFKKVKKDKEKAKKRLDDELIDDMKDSLRNIIILKHYRKLKFMNPLLILFMK